MGKLMKRVLGEVIGVFGMLGGFWVFKVDRRVTGRVGQPLVSFLQSGG